MTFLQIDNLTTKFGNTTVLDSLNLNVEAGSLVSVLGPSGCGKSTLLRSIAGFVPPVSGTIRIAGKLMSVSSVLVPPEKRNIGYVPQEVFLFSDSIRNNIAFSTNHDYTEQEVIQASKDAGVYDNIMAFPEGFDTVVGERGVTLSGGQKQRISIARAIISKPQILIFDDCLSAVDVETEELILNNLKSIMKDKTTIIISHRDSALRYADKVVEL